MPLQVHLVREFKVKVKIKITLSLGCISNQSGGQTSQAGPLARAPLHRHCLAVLHPQFLSRNTALRVTQARGISEAMAVAFLARGLVLNPAIAAVSAGGPCFSSSSKCPSAQLSAVCYITRPASTGTAHLQYTLPVRCTHACADWLLYPM